jgi:curved DNA-binding protein CbpA
MADVFISHSLKNSHAACVLKEGLEKVGLTSWKAPGDILAGQTWEDAITDAISQSTVFLLLWSAESQRSQQVKRELSLAASMNKLVIPLRINPVDLQGAFAYYLTNKHWKDFSLDKIDDIIQSIKHQVFGLPLLGPDSEVNQEWDRGLVNAESRDRFPTDQSRLQASLLDSVYVINTTEMEARLGHIRAIQIGIEDSAENLDVKIPPGAKSGTRLRLKGKGNKCTDTGNRGDLYLVIAILGK